MTSSRVEFLFYIAGRTDAYGEEQPDGSIKVVCEPLTRRVLEDHLAGRRNIAVFLISPLGQVRAGCFTIMEHSPRARLALVRLRGRIRELLHEFVAFLVEEIPEEGYRGWVVFPAPCPAGLVASLLRNLAQEVARPGMPLETSPTEEEVRRLGFPTAEEFPLPKTLTARLSDPVDLLHLDSLKREGDDAP